MIKAVIVDDEFLARQRVLKLLEEYDQIKVIGEAKNGTQAVEIIDLKVPDLVFLDVQMPDFDGFEVITKLKHRPYIVFTTAYDQYAIQAFNIHALDYLLKPIDAERFEDSIKKVEAYFKIKRSSEFSDQLMKMVKDFQRPSSQFLTLIKITDRGREHDVDLDDVLYIEATGNYVTLHQQEGQHLYRTPLSNIETQLNPKDFLRIHRSIIINKNYVRKCVYTNNNEYEFVMKNDKILFSGRSYKDEIVAYLG